MMTNKFLASGSAPGGARATLRLLLTALTGLALFAIAVVGAVSLWEAREANRAATRAFIAKDVTADILPPPLYLIEMRLVLSQAIEGNLSPAQAATEYRRLAAEYEARAAYWEAHPPYGLEGRLLGAQHEAGKAFIAATGRLLEQIDGRGGNAAAVQAGLERAHAAYLSHRAGVDATVKESTVFAESSIAAFEASYRTTFWKLAGLLTCAAIGLLAFGVWIRRAISAPLARAVVVADRVADGDLTERIAGSSIVETGHLLGALERMQQSLTQIVTSVRSNADELASAGSQIAEASNGLSSRTEEQASALQETAASMEQLTSTVARNAENAHEANSLALGASTVAVRGGEVVSEVVTTMKGISEASRKIEAIIAVIDGIAFQTNILALNAAVEAARAGEQGRGFAVVAAEVRMLAGRAADAAKEIKELILASVERVEAGTALVDRAGTTMAEVVDSIRRVTDIMGEISTASSEQSTGLAQVSEAVNQMDRATQENSALVEESAAAAESLKRQAQQLVQVVAVFTLDPHAPVSDAMAAPARVGVPERPERRGPSRARNVMRPRFGAREVSRPSSPAVPAVAPAKTGTDDDWTSF